MFKLRRPSVCSDVDIVSDSSSASDVSDEIYKGVSINSISESRPTLLVEGSSGKWKGGSEYCDKKKSSSKDVDRRESTSSDICVADGGVTTTESGKQMKTGTRQSNCSDNNCSSPTTTPTTITTSNLNSSSSSSSSSASSPVGIMCDRKRKERHESCSQGQEKKVIRSLSHEDPKIEVEAENNTTTTTAAAGTTTETNFQRSHSNDNFESKGGAPAGESVDDVELLEQEQLESNGKEQQQRVTGKANGCEVTKQQQQQTGNHINNSSGPVDSTLYGLGSLSNPQYGIVKNMPTDFEAELQRKWERSAQWSSSSSSRKVHSGRKHRSRSSKSSSSTAVAAVAAAPTVPRKSLEELAVDDGQDFDELSGVIGGSFNEDELHSPTSEDSSTSSIESLEDMENQEKLLSPNISCGEICEADLAEDLSLEQCELADASQSQQREPKSLGNENNLEPVPHLDFSTLLHHQVETNEPIPFLAALQASGAEDQVMLSPRNSVLIKEASDPSIPPSPPLHQAMLDPPLSRQHGGNQNMKMNLLSKQVSNLKRHLKSLEEEYEQLFGYRPSHADKLNQKEMRKCLLQLTKAKRELKEMREDPANLNCGGLLQVDQSCVGPNSFPRNSPEALRSLDATVKEIYKTMNDKRRVQCRPVDPNLMTQSELNEEKNVMQKQLLMLEKRHGRPGSKEEKEIVRSLYDRYRNLKKTGSRLGNIKENSIDLAPILEHETLELSSSGGNNEGETNTTAVVEVIKKDTGSSRKGRRRVTNATDGDEDEDGILNFRNEGFTDMSLSELESRQSLARDEKRRLRSVLRKFEADFQNATGRPPLKDEKYSSAEMENIYQKYKRSRATVRLLDVLITKRKYPQLLVDMNKIED